MDLKELKQLADLCRKAGIRHYKTADFEFTLDLDAPVKAKRSKRSSTTAPTSKYPNSGSDEIESDTLTEDQLLMWSTQNPVGIDESN